MREVRVIFDFTGYWHMGTGSAKGYELDAVVARDSRKLPYIPGRTVKGLLREAVTLLVEAEASTSGEATREQPSPLDSAPVSVDALFGHVNSADESRYEGTSGALVFSNAVLDPDPMRDPQWDAALTPHFYRSVASTALDEQGMAASRTLRRIEVAVPLRLSAVVSAPSALPPDWVSLMQRAAPLLRAVGSHRHRGLGRVKVSVEALPDVGVQ